MAIPIPTSGLFSQDVTNMPKGADLQVTPALMANMEALINPTEVLQRKQAEQVLAMTAGMNTEGLNSELSKKGLEQIESYKQSLINMYKSNKGMGRLRLTPTQQLEVQNMQKDLMGQINWGKQATKDHERALGVMNEALRNNQITPEEMKQWMSDWGGKVTKAKTLGDVPNAYMDALTYLSNKPIKAKEFNLQEIEKVYDPAVDAISKRGFTQPTIEQARTFVNEQYKPGSTAWNYILSEMQKQGLPPGTTDEQAREIYAKGVVDRAKAREKPASYYFGSSTTQPVDVEYVDDNEGRHWFLSSFRPHWAGTIDGKAKSGEITSIDRDKNGKLVANVNVAGKGTDEFGNSITTYEEKQVPVTPDLTAKLKKQKINVIGLEEATKQPQPTKLTGKIDTKTLKVGKMYDVNGTTYKWNGTKLVKP